jgi:hypothetical protein
MTPPATAASPESALKRSARPREKPALRRTM